MAWSDVVHATVRDWTGAPLMPVDFERDFKRVMWKVDNNENISRWDLVEVAAYFVLWIIIYNIFMSAIATPLARYCLPKERFVLAPKAKKTKGAVSKAEQHANPQGKPVYDPEAHADGIHKFVTAAWKLFSFGSLAILGSYVISTTDWAFDPPKWWGWPLVYEWNVQRFYLFDLAYWLQTCLVLVNEPKLKDRNQMWAHHIVTILLIVFSYVCGVYRVGLIIMTLHDLADPWMEAAKLCLYQGKQRFADVFFVMFAAVFYFTRLYVYPFYVIHSVIYDFTVLNPPDDGFWGFVSLLCCLQILHVFWGFLIAKIIYAQVAHGTVQGDVRED